MVFEVYSVQCKVTALYSSSYGWMMVELFHLQNEWIETMIKAEIDGNANRAIKNVIYATYVV